LKTLSVDIDCDQEVDVSTLSTSLAYFAESLTRNTTNRTETSTDLYTGLVSRH